MARIPHFDEADLERSLEERFVRRGLDYFKRGMVLSVDPGGDGLLVGRVRGSGAQTYNVLVRLRMRAGAVQLSGACSCPVGGGCKHVAAVLYHFLSTRPSNALRVDSGISDSTRLWLEQLRIASDSVGSRILSSRERILYLLRMSARAPGMVLEVDTVIARPLRSGRMGAAKRFRQGPRSTAQFVTEEDRRVLQLLEARREDPDELPLLMGGGSRRLLEELIATGRCHWRESGSPPLSWDEEPLESALGWWEGDGGFTIGVVVDEHSRPLPTLPPSRYDPARGCCSPLIAPLPDAVVAALAGAPMIPTEQVAELAGELGRLVPKAPRPELLERVVREGVEPTPCLHLFSENLSPAEEAAEWVECGELHFDYAGHPVHPLDQEPVTIRGHGRLETIPRQRERERQALERLRSIGLVAEDLSGEGTAAELVPLYGEEERAWLNLMAELLPRLEREGWRITVDPSFRLRMSDPEGWYGEVEEAPAGGWFDLELGVEVEGRRINLMPLLAAQLADERRAVRLRRLGPEESLVIPLEGGAMVRLPAGRIRRLVEVLIELYDRDSLVDERLRLGRLQAPRLLELEEEGEIAWGGEKAVREYGRRLTDFRGIEAVKPPRGLKAKLRLYQQQGLNWLQFLRRHELGGVLADDMGLGKTVQTLAHLLKEKEARRADRPSLVVAPTSLMVNWRREAERFAPGLKVLTLHGPGRKDHFAAIGDYDLVLTTYPLLGRDLDALTAQPYHLLILDEAQQIKNPKAKAWQAARALEARHRLALTGTPMENHLGELWSLFDQLLPGYLGESSRFTKLFRTPIEKRGDAERHAALRRRTAPFMLRREKGEVVLELPLKSEIVSEVELEGGQRDLYETLRLSMSKRVREEIEKKGLARSHITILDALLKLRQVCCDPRLLKIEGAKRVNESAKLTQLMELLPEMVEEGRRVLIFSQFTTMLGLIEAELKRHKLGYVKLTGQSRDRATPVDRFQAGEVPIFLISLKAGGSGLNLTAADTVIHYDPWWNPAVERQATDRAHRIGQRKPVFVYRLIARGTVEERIAEMQARKRELADSLFAEGGKGVGALTGEELQALFEPLGG